MNYKKVVNCIYSNEHVSFSFNTDHCKCPDSSLYDPYQKDIIAGDL